MRGGNEFRHHRQPAPAGMPLTPGKREAAERAQNEAPCAGRRGGGVVARGRGGGRGRVPVLVRALGRGARARALGRRLLRGARAEPAGRRRAQRLAARGARGAAGARTRRAPRRQYSFCILLFSH
jgi:hypothetical protein